MEKKNKKEYAKIIILGVLILAFALSIVFTSSISKGIKSILLNADIKASEDDLVVHFINVGQGDAIALQLPDDKTMLIDSGPKDSQNVLVQYVRDEVLKSENYLVIDYLILTHPDLDHSGGMSALFGEFEIKNFFRPNIASDSENKGDFLFKSTLEEYDALIKLANQEKDLNINIVNQEFDFNVGDVRVQIFPPVKEYNTTNELSCVVKVSRLGKSFLFTGDIQEDSERDLVAKYGEELDADVLKVAHHGSKTSTSQQFVDAVTPNYAVICVGDNTYGHPNFMVVARLENIGAEVLTTLKGDVRIVCGTDSFGVLGNTIHSFEFVQWWIIALMVEIILIYNISSRIFSLIKKNKQELSQPH